MQLRDTGISQDENPKNGQKSWLGIMWLPKTSFRWMDPSPLAEMLSTAIQFSHTGFINKKDSFGYGDFDSKLGFSVQEIPQVWSQLFVYKIPFDLWLRNHWWHRKSMLAKTLSIHSRSFYIFNIFLYISCFFTYWPKCKCKNQ